MVTNSLLSFLQLEKPIEYISYTLASLFFILTMFNVCYRRNTPQLTQSTPQPIDSCQFSAMVSIFAAFSVGFLLNGLTSGEGPFSSATAQPSKQAGRMANVIGAMSSSYIYALILAGTYMISKNPGVMKCFGDKNMSALMIGAILATLYATSAEKLNAYFYGYAKELNDRVWMQVTGIAVALTIVNGVETGLSTKWQMPALIAALVLGGGVLPLALSTTVAKKTPNSPDPNNRQQLIDSINDKLGTDH